MDAGATHPHSSVCLAALRRGDYVLLVLLTFLLYGYALVHARVLSTHEAVHCLNVREMRASRDWLIPTYGGRPWLERPPLPHWVTAAAAALTGAPDREWALRLGSIVMGLAGVLLTARLAGLWYGRAVGLVSGAALATMGEFARYAVGPEADITLCTVVLAANALFVELEFRRRPAGAGEDTRFLGRRPGLVLAFFAAVGLTGWAKGPLFGTLFVALPLAGYFLWNADGRGLRRYVWLWGGLAFALVGLAWPLAAWHRYPDVVELWQSDYGNRWNKGYIGEPFWYYLVHLPWDLFPWTAPAAVGLAATARPAFRERSPAARYLWCWALLPVAFLSLPQGKHHHYLLPCLAPWAVLSAVGAVRVWQVLREAPRRLRQPWLAVLAVGLPVDLALLVWGKRLPGPTWQVPALLVGWPLCLAAFWWAAGRRDGRLAFGSVLALLVGLHWLTYAHRTEYIDSYRDDLAFLREVPGRVPAGRPLLVKNDLHPLDASWVLFYLGDRAGLLHNLTFLRGDHLRGPEVYLVCRGGDEPFLAEYGVAERVLQSRHTHGEQAPRDRWTLYRLRFHADLARRPADVRISPVQATGRAPGPFLLAPEEHARLP